LAEAVYQFHGFVSGGEVEGYCEAVPGG